MKIIDKNSWNRREHFEFFSSFDEPFFGLVAEVDCTVAYKFAKETGRSFFAHYLHLSLVAANSIDELRFRIHDGEAVEFDEIHASTTIGRDDGTFSVTFVPFSKDFSVFDHSLKKEIQAVQESTGLRLNKYAKRNDVIHFSSIPWTKFTGLTHARKYGDGESEPKISFGKTFLKEDQLFMSVGVFVHHGLADGYHVSRFLEKYQELLNKVH